MVNKLIVITGTPGTGKSTLAKLLAKKLKLPRLNLHQFYKQISLRYNAKKQCYDLDNKKVLALVQKELKHNKTDIIIDSHISHLLPKKLVRLCIVLQCSNLKQLQRRLKKRKYSKKKIRENLDAEIFQVCLLEAQERKQKLLVFDTSAKNNFDTLKTLLLKTRRYLYK